MPPDVSIIIVSWNVADYLRDCLASISSIDSITLETIVVDANSTDNTATLLQSEFPEITLLQQDTNVGFSRGNNLGIEAASGRYIFLLNPDTIVEPNSIERMVTYLDQHSQVGVLGPQLLNPDRTVQSSRRRFPSFWTGIFESTWLQPIAPKRILDRYYVADSPDNRITDVDWVQGAAFMVRRSCIEGVGVFDERYFMYSEELDWQRRIKQAGWDIVYFPPATVIHYGGKSSEQTSAETDIRFHTSKLRYFAQYHGAFQAFLIRLVIIGNYWWQLAVESAKWALGHKRALRGNRIRRYWTVLRHGLRIST